MRTYHCSVTGFRYEGREPYIKRHLKEGSPLTLVREPRNIHDRFAVAVYHGNQNIGYIPSSKRWVAKSIDEGDQHQIWVDEVDVDEGDLLKLIIKIAIVKDGKPKPRRRWFSFFGLFKR
jgi:hypothetical protein